MTSIPRPLIDVTGTRIDSDYEVPLGPKGWHMISTPRINVYWVYCRFRRGEEVLNFESAVSQGWIAPFIWKWNPTANTYERYTGNGVIEPWVGYWIRTYVDNLTLILPVHDAIHNPPLPPTAELGPLALEPGLTPPAPPSLAALAKDYLSVLAYPNPATAGTVTFRALGLPVEAIRVSVFDLGGRKVWAGEAVGPTLAWNLADSSGRPLANGVYLYVVEARLSGEWVSTGLQRLLILR